MAVVNVEWPLSLLASASGAPAVLVREHLVELFASNSVAREAPGAPGVRAQLGVLPLVRVRLPVPFGTGVLQPPFSAVAGAA